MLKTRFAWTVVLIILVYGALIGFQSQRIKSSTVNYDGYTVILWDNGIQMKNENFFSLEILNQLIDSAPEKTAVVKVRQDVELVKDFKDSAPDFNIYKNIGGTDFFAGFDLALEKALSVSPSRIVILSKGYNMLGSESKIRKKTAVPVVIIYFNEKKDLGIDGATYQQYSDVK